MKFLQTDRPMRDPEVQDRRQAEVEMVELSMQVVEWEEEELVELRMRVVECVSYPSGERSEGLCRDLI